MNIFKFIALVISLIALTACDSLSHNTRNATHTNIAEPVSVAIFLPLTGPAGDLGQEYNYMIKKGLLDHAKTKIKLSSYDTSTEESLQEAMNKVIKNKTDIIIGPIYSSSTKHIAQRAKKHNITILSLSNDPSLADGNLFVLGHAPMRQFESLMQYLLQHDYKNYIIFFPSGRYSKSLASVLQNMILTANATMVRTDFYSDDAQNISDMIDVISDNVDQLNEMDNDAKKPIILLSDDTQTLSPVLQNIVKNNLDKKAIIVGDSRVNIDGFDDLELIYTGNMNMKYQMLAQDAKQHNIIHIGFMHNIAYDAGSIVADTIGAAPFNKENFVQKMQHLSGFEGLSGVISFDASLAQRKYKIIQRQNNRYSILTRASG